MTAPKSTTDNLPATLPVHGAVEVNHEALDLVESAVTSIIDPDDPWAGVDACDLSPATISRGLPLFALNRKEGGGFIDTDTGEKMLDLDFIWLAKSTSRAWWPKPFGKGDPQPACRSFDGLKPDPKSPEVQSPVCATCPQNRWPEKDEEFRRCSDAVEALVFLPDPLGFGRLARIRLSGMAVKPALEYWDSFKARLPYRPPVAYLTHCTLVPTETPNGTFLVPAFRRMKEYAFAELAPVIVERDQRLTEWTSAVAEDVAAGVTHEDAGVADEPTGGTEAGTYTADGMDEPF